MNPTARLNKDTAKDPETLEREIKQTRAEMNQTLDSLERKLTAGQLVDQCLRFFGKTGSELGSSIGNSAKANPMPFLLTATGIAWMMFGSARPARDYRSDATDGQQASGGLLSEMGDSLQSGATAARSQFAGSQDAVKEGFNNTTQTVKETVNKTKDTVTDTVSKAASAAQNQAIRAREGFNVMLEEQPLVLGLVAIAIGAAIGAALPRTEQEDRLVGEIRDKAMAKAKEFGAESYEKGRAAVKDKVESTVRTMSKSSDATVHS
jgi:Protein of unknown function (DUF3618)